MIYTKDHGEKTKYREEERGEQSWKYRQHEKEQNKTKD